MNKLPANVFDLDWSKILLFGNELIMPPLRRRGGYTVLALSIGPSVRLSVCSCVRPLPNFVALFSATSASYLLSVL